MGWVAPFLLTPRSGAPPHYTAENKAFVLQAARTRPSELGLPYNSWTFERLADYVPEHLGIQMKKMRIFEILQEGGLHWRKFETWDEVVAAVEAATAY